MGITHDELLEVRVEVEDLRRQLSDAESHIGGLKKRMGLVGYRLGELARQLVVPTVTGRAGAPCAEYEFREAAPDVAQDEEPLTHAMEPLDNAALYDDPPSRPLPQPQP